MKHERNRGRGSEEMARRPRPRGEQRRRRPSGERGNSLILIGMAGAGKSTVGRRLSRRYGKRYIDIDDVLVEQEGRSVAELAASLPFREFVRRESRAACSVHARDAIIATGGSVIYSRRSMEHLRQLGTVVYLNKPFYETRRYSGDPKKRGIVMPPDQTPETYQKHRHRLYLRYADIVLWTENAKIHETVGYLSGILEYIDPEHFQPLPNLVRNRPKPRKNKRRGRGRGSGSGRNHRQQKSSGSEKRQAQRPSRPRQDHPSARADRQPGREGASGRSPSGSGHRSRSPQQGRSRARRPRQPGTKPKESPEAKN